VSAATGAAFPWYVGGVASWFLALGLQNVIVSGLAALELGAAPGQMAGVQMAQQLPGFGLILLGGAIADRVDRRALLLALHLASAAVVALLAFALELGRLSYPVLVAYVLGLSVLSAFVIPARDALLSDVAGANLMRAVTLLTMTQWGVQALGSSLGIAGRHAGMLALVALQGFVLLAGIPALWRLPARAAPVAARPPLRLADLLHGVREVASSRVLAPVALLSVVLGVLFIGTFIVVFPLLVRDHYGGDVADLALLQTTFPLGTITGSALILWRGGIRRKGRAQLLALAFGALCLCALALGLPFPLALCATTLFGVGGAFFVNAGRMLFQEHATAANRGRVLSVYVLAFMGSSGIVGAPLGGFLYAELGPLGACGFAGAAMLAVVAAVGAFTDVRKLE
jgi:MFS family permease